MNNITTWDDIWFIFFYCIIWRTSHQRSLLRRKKIRVNKYNTTCEFFWPWPGLIALTEHKNISIPTQTPSLSYCSSTTEPPYMYHIRGEFFSDSVFSDGVQCSESVFRVLVKKTIIMRIHENNAYWLGTMDQDADSVWAMTLNCLGCINTYSQ